MSEPDELLARADWVLNATEQECIDARVDIEDVIADLAAALRAALAARPQLDNELRAAAENLQRLETPFGAYQRWSKDGNTADAEKLQAWDDARVALSRALVATSATPTGEHHD